MRKTFLCHLIAFSLPSGSATFFSPDIHHRCSNPYYISVQSSHPLQPLKSPSFPQSSNNNNLQGKIFSNAHHDDQFADHGYPSIPIPKLTVILPAYNEALRIEETLTKYSDYLSTSPTLNESEILVVDDGSDDGTPKVVSEWASSFLGEEKISGVTVRTVSLPENQGKGAAIARGCRELSGDTHLVLVADADGSADITCVEKMMEALLPALLKNPPNDSKPKTTLTRDDPSSVIPWNTPAMVVGNRGYNTRSIPRLVLRWGFRTTVLVLCGDLHVRDTQCGFKLMTKTASLRLYPSLHLRGWTHDVELLFMARRLNIPVMERDIIWVDKDGSKLVTSPGGAAGASVLMLLEVLFMRVQYLLGNWNDEMDGN